MKIYKSDLNTIGENEIKLYIPMVMINVAQRVYSENKTSFSCSIECMWNLVTKCKMPLSKTKRDELVGFVKVYLTDKLNWEIDNLEWNTELNFNYYEESDNFIIININDITDIFTKEKRFDKIANNLAIILETHSYMDGNCIYMTKEQLIMDIQKLKENPTEIEITNSKEWFKGFTYKKLKEDVSPKFVAYPDVEVLLSKRYNNDKNPFDKMIVAESNFNNYIKELEKLGIICKVQTKYGQYHNKVVFCRVEHRDIVEALYIRLCELEDMAEEYNEPEKPVEVLQETPKQNKNAKPKCGLKGTRNF